MEACEEGEDKTEGRLEIQSLALNSISALLGCRILSSQIHLDDSWCPHFPVRAATWMALIHSVRSLGVAACR